MGRLLSYDPLTGIKTTFHYEHGAKKPITIQTTQDCQAIVENAKKLANDSSYKQAGIKSDHYHFARVPCTVLMEIKEKYNLDWAVQDDLPKIEKVLQRDYKYLLTVNRI